MPKGYVIAEVEVTDPALYEEYRAQVQATVHAYDGRFLVRGGEAKRLEGKRPLQRMVVLEFPSVEQAQRWYDSTEYGLLKELRFRAANAHLTLVAGADA